MGDPRRALALLHDAAASGELGELCRRYDVTLLIAFGSTVRGERNPQDLDLAAMAENLDAVGMINDLMTLAELNEIDLMDLRRAGPVAQQRALTTGEVLFEARPRLFALRQATAMLEFMDTAWMRHAQLELLAR